ncbi:MAG: DoxX family protein [Candidatus Nomurabacteria bacterium]|nr:DoxX family protein [Candidatus Nomurabacteria bacterium]
MMILFLLGRVLLGGYFLMSAYNHFSKSEMLTNYAKSKNVPLAHLAVLLTGVMLLLGGFGILLWVYLKASIALLAIFLTFVTIQMHAFWKITDPASKMSEQMSFTKNMALLGALLIIIAFL